jgi:hypothetical protein
MSGCGKKLYEPIIIPRGKNGKSVCIAFADDENGTNFSFTLLPTSTHLSIISCSQDCGCDGTIDSSKFTTWIKVTGENGVSISSVIVSDGINDIQGVVYNTNHLIVILSDNTVIDAGPISVNLIWQNIPLINGYAAVAGQVSPQYALTSDGKILFRGVLDITNATSPIFNSTLGTLISQDQHGAVFSTSVLTNVGNIQSVSIGIMSRFSALGTSLYLPDVARLNLDGVHFTLLPSASYFSLT